MHCNVNHNAQHLPQSTSFTALTNFTITLKVKYPMEFISVLLYSGLQTERDTFCKYISAAQGLLSSPKQKPKSPGGSKSMLKTWPNVKSPADNW